MNTPPTDQHPPEGGSLPRLVLLCDWCKYDGKSTPAASPERTHINGGYEEELLCDECADWLEQQQNDQVEARDQ